MKHVMARCFGRATLVAAAALFAGGAMAQDFPNRTIKLIVPFTAGTGMDNIARQVGEKMHARMGQAVVVENRLGTAGNLGAEMVARAPADGYTLLVTASNITITANLYATPGGFQPMNDLVPLAIAAWGNATLVVNPSSKASSLPEFLALAKSAPGKVTFASPGMGSPQHIALELFQQQAGVQFLHVPYKGTAPGITDLIAGHVDAMFVATHTVMPYVTSGKLKAIAVGSQSHTSPIATSLISMVFEPVIFSECPVPNAGVSNRAFHPPSASACAEAEAPQEAVTVICSFGSAHPQIVFFMFCCKIMWSPNRLGRRRPVLTGTEASEVALPVGEASAALRRACLLEALSSSAFAM